MTAALWLALALAAPVYAQDAAAFFDDGVVHDLHLQVNSRDWETLKATYETNQYYPATLEWKGVRVQNVGIRSRGNGSRSGVKPGLRVDANRYVTDRRFLGLKSFVLRNNTQDASQMRERLAMGLFRQLGLPAPREAHARLFVNGSFAGLYTIVESIDRRFLEDQFGDDDGYLYDYEFPPDEAPYYFEHRGIDAEHYVPRPFSPETHEDDPRGDVIERLVRVVNAPSTASFRQSIDEYLDLHGTIRHLAAEVFLAEQDGLLGDWGMNNLYLYRPADSTRFSMIPWDKSQTFSDGPTRSIWRNITDQPPDRRNRLVMQILADDDLRQRYYDALLEVARVADARDGGELGWLAGEVERVYAQTGDAIREDLLKPESNEAFETAVEDLRRFARERGVSVSAQVERARAGR